MANQKHRSLVDAALEAAEEEEHKHRQRIQERYACVRRAIRAQILNKLGEYVDESDLVNLPGEQVLLPGNPALIFTMSHHCINVRVEGAPLQKSQSVHGIKDVGKAIRNQVDYLPPEPEPTPGSPASTRWCPRCRNDLWIQDIDERSEHFRCNYCMLEGTLTID